MKKTHYEVETGGGICSPHNQKLKTTKNRERMDCERCWKILELSGISRTKWHNDDKPHLRDSDSEQKEG